MSDETTVEEKPRRGSRPFKLTSLAQAADRAERRLRVLTKAAGVDKARAKLEKAQQEYDEAVAKADELEDARAEYEEAKRKLEEAMSSADE
jgi:chromosome segregation ATPase